MRSRLERLNESKRFPNPSVAASTASEFLPLKGEIDLHVSPALTESLNAMTKKEPARIVIDLSDATYIDSSAWQPLFQIFPDVDAALAARGPWLNEARRQTPPI
jgi:ABC-type transporter Mla MlaB component